MECLNNYIGIKGCGSDSEDPASGFTINELPGVNLEMIQSLADADQETFLGVWADVKKRAMAKFELAVKVQLNKCYKITDKAVVECLVCEVPENFAVALWYLHGVELMIERTSSDRLNWYTTIDLEKAEKLKSEFYTEYTASLEDAVQSLDPEKSDCVTDCLECNGAVKWAEQTP